MPITDSGLGRSRMAFAPAQTTITGVCASSCRSALMSLPRLAFPLAPPPRCTPPMPPVAKTSMPAWCAIHMVAATVVAPSNLRATAMGRSRRLTLRTFAAVARCIISASSSPATSSPPNDARAGARLRAVVAHHGLHVPRQRQVLRIRQAMRDDRGLRPRRPVQRSRGILQFVAHTGHHVRQPQFLKALRRHAAALRKVGPSAASAAELAERGRHNRFPA